MQAAAAFVVALSLAALNMPGVYAVFSNTVTQPYANRNPFTGQIRTTDSRTGIFGNQIPLDNNGNLVIQSNSRPNVDFNIDTSAQSLPALSGSDSGSLFPTGNIPAIFGVPSNSAQSSTTSLGSENSFSQSSNAAVRTTQSGNAAALGNSLLLQGGSQFGDNFGQTGNNVVGGNFVQPGSLAANQGNANFIQTAATSLGGTSNFVQSGTTGILGTNFQQSGFPTILGGSNNLAQSGNAVLGLGSNLAQPQSSVTQSILDTNVNLFPAQGSLPQSSVQVGPIAGTTPVIDRKHDPFVCTVTRTIDFIEVKETTKTLPYTVLETEFRTTLLTSVTTKTITTEAFSHHLIYVHETTTIQTQTHVTDTTTDFGSSLLTTVDYSTTLYTSSTFHPKTEYLTTTIPIVIDYYRTTTKYVQKYVTSTYTVTATNLVIAVNTKTTSLPYH